MKKLQKILLPIVFFALAALLLCSCAGKTPEKGEMIAEISGENIIISAAFTDQVVHANEGKMLYLFELEPGETVYELASLTPVAEVEMAEVISFTLPLSKSGASRLSFGFVLATRDSVQNIYSPMQKTAVYVSNPEVLATDDDEQIKTESIKGILAESLSHTVSVGASHALIDLPIEDYLLPEGKIGAIRHEFAGESFYFNEETVSSLEKKLSALDGAECAVYLRIYLGSSEEELPEALRFLSYPGTEKGLFEYSLNYGNEKAARAYCAFVDLMVKRNPAAMNFIVGKAQNSPTLGSRTDEGISASYLAEYSAALHITYNIVRSTRSCANVFCAVDSYMTSAASTSGVSAQSFILSLADLSAREGDYPWGIAAECTPAIAGSDSVWYNNESNAILSPTNLSYFTDKILGEDKLLYEDWTRSFIISDFSVTSAPANPMSESKQSASYAYTYYEAVKTGKISALIYSSIFDTESRTDGIINASGKKEIYSMMSRIDTDAPIGDEVGEVIGSEWSDLYLNDELREKIAKGKYSSGNAEIGSSDGLELTPIVLFNDGTLCGFDTVDGGFASLVRKSGSSVLEAHFDPQNDSSPFAIAASGISPDLFSGEKLAVAFSVLQNGNTPDTSCKLTLTLIQKSENGRTGIYTSTVSAQAGADLTAIFDISEFSKSKTDDEVTLMLSVDPSESTPFTLTLNKIVSAKVPSNTILVVLLIILGVLLLGGLITLFIFWFRKNYTIDFGGKKKNKKAKGAKR